MKKIIIIATFAIAAFAASCSRQALSPASKAQGTIYADIENTKTVLTQGNAVEWLEGDKISVFAGTSNVLYTATSSGPEVAFTGDEVSGSEFYALYPYFEAASITDGVISTVLPVEQYPTVNSFAGNTGILMGYSTGTHFTFKQVLSYLKIEVAAEGVTSITVRTNDGSPLAGSIKIAWNSGVPSVTALNPVDHVSLIAAEGETIAQGVYYLAALPFSSSTGLSIRFNKASAKTARVKDGGAAAAARAEILDLKQPDVAISAWKDRVDLSADGTANCYIVSAKGEYRFKADKGNSGNASAATVSDWMWADRAGLLSDVLLENDGYVTFSASELKGNSIIAGLKTNLNPTILWSWHIWLTDDPTEHACYGLDDTFEIMDRNLGATSTTVDDVESYGLYYQFARKDPFPGAAEAGSTASGYRENPAFSTGSRIAYNPRFCNGDNFLNGASSYFRVKSNTSGEVARGKEIEKLINRPMTYISYEKGSYCWLYLPDQTSTDVSDAYKDEISALWGNNTSTKTQYDPCPVGWKVMRADKLADNNAGTTYAELFTATGSLKGLKYTSPLNTTTYFPAAGYRVATKSARLGDSGASVVVWTACSRLKADNGDVAWILNASQNKQQSVYTTQAYPVRCQKIK